MAFAPVFVPTSEPSMSPASGADAYRRPRGASRKSWRSSSSRKIEMPSLPPAHQMMERDCMVVSRLPRRLSCPHGDSEATSASEPSRGLDANRRRELRGMEENQEN